MTAGYQKEATGMSGRRKACIVGLLILAGVFIVGVLGIVGVLFLLSPSSPGNQASALEVTKEWGRLADFPAHSKVTEIDVRGTMFTRGFVVVFEAPLPEIEQWVKDSSGLAEAKVTLQEDGSTLYKMDPGGGAQFAEVVIWVSEGLVRIHVYWS